MKAFYSTAVSIAAFSLAIVGAPTAALAGSANTGASSTTTASPGTAAATNPRSLEDNAYVTLTGTVGAVTEQDAFQLDYGAGNIRVDTNDGISNVFKGRGANVGAILHEGDRVTVTGYVDDNWFTGREIDAQMIRAGSKTYTRDTNWTNADTATTADVAEDRVRLTGTITEMVNDNRYRMRYTSNGQTKNIEIDTTGVTGGKDQRFSAGERVTVLGKIDDTLFGRREINAESIQQVGQNATASPANIPATTGAPSAGGNTTGAGAPSTR